MESNAAARARPGLRERKKRRTRETIAKAALQLFAERGYANTTLEDIAEAAEVSKGTIFAYYDSKEDLLFPAGSGFYEELKHRLEQRPPNTTTLDTLRELLATLPPPDETLRLRFKIRREAGLIETHRARCTRVEELIAESFAKDLGTERGDLRAVLLAASTAAALAEIGVRVQPEPEPSFFYEEALEILEQMLTSLRNRRNVNSGSRAERNAR